MLRRIFEPKRDEVAEEMRTFHNVKIVSLYCPLDVIILTNSKRTVVVVCLGGYNGVDQG
jgi:hypothetical protein